MQFIDLKTQYKKIKDDVLKEIGEVLDSGQYILGNKVSELEVTLANYVGVKHCIGVSDGTTALLLALMALELHPDDEVIVPSFTFIATASMVALLGAKVVFVDVDPLTFNIDPEKIKQAITPNTKVIIPVGLYGQCADLDYINEIASKHGILVIEDAAQSFGAKHNNQLSGGITSIACTSFFPSKPLGCYGDGGACFTNDDKIATKIFQLRVHGQAERYYHKLLGINGRLDTLQAAVLLAKMRVFDEELKSRVAIAERYSKLLSGTNCVTPTTAKGNTHVYAQYTIVTDLRDKLAEELAKVGIPTAVHYPCPLHRQSALAQFYTNNTDLSITERLCKQVISLPMHPYLDVHSQDKVVAAVKKVLD